MLKKIAIIIERADISLGGAERSISELAEALRATGLNVDILAAKGQQQSNVHILCSEFGGKRVSFNVFSEAIKKHIAQSDYDIIHSALPFDFPDIYQPRGGTYAETIERNAASYQNKFLEVVKKATAFTNFRRSRLLLAEKQLCKNPNGPTVVALSQYVAHQFKHHYMLNENRLFVIPNGVKEIKSVPADETSKTRQQILSTLNLAESDNPVLFLFAANNFRLKGLYPLIKSLKPVLNKTKKIALIVIGNGEVTRYLNLAKSLGLDNNIAFLGAVANIQNYLNACDVAILPTFYDPASRFILEALTAGKPVITTKFNGAADLFENKKHGIVIDSPQNIDQLASAIQYFADDNNRQKATAAIINDNLAENISIARVARQMIKLYEQILARKRRTTI